MRFTPQPQGMPSSNVDNAIETTHVTDSMPGTAADVASLRRQLARLEEAYQKERTARKAEEQRFREHEAIWDERQTMHEDLTREHRILQGQHKDMQEKLESSMKSNDISRERLVKQTTELRQVTEQLEQQRATDLLSEDQRIVEITQLRKDLAIAQAAEQRSSKNAESADSMLEYTKEQWRVAQDAASTSQTAVEALTTSNAKLQFQASGEAANLKSLHYERQFENEAKKCKKLRDECNFLRRRVAQLEEDLAKAKNHVGRIGVGTRAQSVTPQPKTRSRAGSPLGGRLSNLRKE